MHTHKAMAGIGVALGLLMATGCGGGDCGDAEFTTGGDALVLFDEDGDGATADLREACGVDNGSFGFRRNDVGLTMLLFEPSPMSSSFEDQLDLENYLLPSSTVTFLTSHLEAGATLTMDNLGGSGLHHLGGMSTDLYTTFTLLDGTVEVVDGPRKSKSHFAEEDHTEEWRFHWTLEIGDAQSGVVYQTWDAEDWISISDGTEIGEPIDVPPDAVTSP